MHEAHVGRHGLGEQRTDSQGASDHHFVSVVVPTIGRASLAACVSSLYRQTRPPDEINVVRDVNGRGGAWARNEGIDRSRGDLVGFLDDDVILPVDWLERLIAAVDAQDAAGACGGLEEADRFLQDIRSRRTRRAQVAERSSAPRQNGGLMLYRREWLETCRREDGYVFNERLRHSAEDWELVLRLRYRGADLVSVPVTARHLRRSTPVDYLRNQFKRGRGIATLFELQRALGTVVDPQPSLLWNAGGITSGAKWLRVLWFKVVGPFDVGSFSSRRHFWLFWLGEKLQGAGFLYQQLRDRISVRDPSRRRRRAEKREPVNA